MRSVSPWGRARAQDDDVDAAQSKIKRITLGKGACSRRGITWEPDYTERIAPGKVHP